MSSGSFIPINRAVPSRLSGTPIISTIIDRRSVDRLSRGLGLAMRAEATRLALFLSQRTFALLNQMESGVGHRFLAGKWTNTQPQVDANGRVTVEVWNQAENETFQTPSNAPNSRKTYPIAGRRLLEILLNGAKAHDIRSRDPKKVLQFSAVAGQRQSRFAGTAITTGGVVGARFLNSNQPDTLIRIGMVKHPGVIGNRFLQVAKVRLEQMIAAEAPLLAGRVQARI